MHLIKPSWVLHPDETRPTRPDLTIYSLDIHPDNSRLATGGLDAVVRIWSTAPILDEAVEKQEAVPKLLCTLTAHTGVVMSVRWSNNGAYLASGSDDRVVMIWAHEGTGGGKVWGSETTNVENWKASRRLVGHNSDVAGVDWSPDDAYVASVGLDNVVLIWSGHTFELVRKLDAHLGFVKGLVFDPAGQFLATQADDNSLKVWRTDTWMMVGDVQEVFEDAPKANVMRPTWSPDGAYIVTPNSMNGPVFCAAVIERNTWKSPASLIGHPDMVQCAAYNPLIFLRDETQPGTLGNVCSLLALSAQGTVSLWFTHINEPFIVLTDVMDRDVLDMRWSKDGTQLWLSSSEGHVACLQFALSEYAPVAPQGTQATLFATQYNVAPVKAPISRPLSAQSSLSTATGGTMAQPNTLVARKGPNAKRPRTVQLSTQPFAPAQPSPLQNAMQMPMSGAGAQQQPMPQLAQQQPQVNPFAAAPTYPAQAAMAGNAFASTSAAQLPPQQFQPPPMPGPQAFGAFGAPPPQPAPIVDLTAASTSTLSAKKRKTTTGPAPIDGPTLPPFAFPYPYPHAPYAFPPPGAPPGQVFPQPPPFPMPVPPDIPPGYVGGPPRMSEAPYRLNGHTLSRTSSAGGEKEGKEEKEKRELVPTYCLYDRETTFRVSNRAKGKEREVEGLAVPAVVSMGKIELEDKEGGDVFEWRNLVEGDGKGTAELTVANAKKSLWVDYVPKYVVSATGSPAFSAVSLEDGTLIAWSPTGRRLIPTLVLDAPCSFLEAEGSYLLAITAIGTLIVWNLSPSIAKPRSIYPPLNISTLLSSSATRTRPSPVITTSALLPNGTPLLALSTGATFSYDADLAAWTRLSEPWWAQNSGNWEGRRGRPAGQAGITNKGTIGIIRQVESAVNEIVVNEQVNGEGDAGTTDGEEEAATPKENGTDVEMNGENGAGDKGKSKAVDGVSSPILATSTPRPPKRPIPTGTPAVPTASQSDFRTAVSLSHLETRMQAAIAWDSPSEYKQFLVQYAKRLAEEGLKSKAEELVRELLGPIYHKSGKEEEERWLPSILGLQKRDLLKDVLRELGKSRLTSSINTEYQDILKKVTTPW
ncbi:hypothetical protein JCM11641_005703 [Rhodosporidiobolus odoratus]